MTSIQTTRELHSQLNLVCTSLEAIFRLAGSDFEEMEAAASPAMMRFRELLDLGDSLVQPD